MRAFFIALRRGGWRPAGAEPPAMKRSPAVVLFASVLAAATCAGADPGAAMSNASAPELGSTAPPFVAKSIATGATLANADFAGKILVVNFWATWCPPCRSETPGMIRLYRALHGSGVEFLGIDTTEVAPVVKTFLSAKGVPYPTALAGPDVYRRFGVAYIPTTIVIDAHGIVRATWTGALAPERLAEFVAAARTSTNYALDTPDQALLERLLDPSAYDFSGDAASVAPAVKRSRDNVAAADAFVAAHEDGANTTIDYTRVQTLEGALLVPAAQQSMRVATSAPERVAADRLLALGDEKLNRYADAIAALRDARTIAPSDNTLLLGITKADYRLHDYQDGVASAHAYTAAVPGDADGWNWLALSEQRAADFKDAAPDYERAIALLRAAANNAAKRPSDRADAIATVADTSLDLANVYVALGDVPAATRAFATANSYGDRLDPEGPYADLYRNVHERTQEGLIAVRMARGDRKTALSVAPWTGPDLPGSVSSTLKYRLIIASAPNARVNLEALHLRRGWIASFCADGLCSPNHVELTLPPSGVKTYEFQLVPPGATRDPGNVTIRSSDGTAAVVSELVR